MAAQVLEVSQYPKELISSSYKSQSKENPKHHNNQVPP